MQSSTIKRFFPILFLIFLFVIAYFSGLKNYLTFDALKENRGKLITFTDEHPILSVLIYIGIYAGLVAVSFPGGAFITIAGGFIFQQPMGTIYTLIGATIGATIIFSAAKTAFGKTLQQKASPFLQKMESGFRENEAQYMLFLRLVPLFPFWVVNLAPALFGVRLFTFIWTTFVGIIPGTFVYAQAGAGLGAIFESGDTLTLEGIFNWKLRLAVIALGLLLLLPIIIKKIRKKNAR